MNPSILFTSSFCIPMIMLLSNAEGNRIRYGFNINHKTKKQPDADITTSNIPKISPPSTEEVSNSLTTEKMHQDQPLLSHQTLTSTTKTRLETEQTTNREGMLDANGTLASKKVHEYKTTRYCNTTSNIPKNHAVASKLQIVSTQSTEVFNSLTIEDIHQDLPLLSHQTLTNTAKTRLEKEQTTNREEMYLPSGENEPWGKNKSFVICIIGLSCITVVMAVLHIGWCVVDVLCIEIL